MECLVCGSLELMGHVTLSYDAPLAKRGGAIKVGGIKVTQLDVRAAWEKLDRRPIHCFECGTKHVYDVSTAALMLEEES